MQADHMHPTLLRAALTAGATLNTETRTVHIPRAQTTTFPYEPLSHRELGIKGYTKRHAGIGDFETIVFDDAGKEHVIWRNFKTDFTYGLTKDWHTHSARPHEYAKSYLGVDFEVVVRDHSGKEHIVWRVDLRVVKKLFEELEKLTKIMPIAMPPGGGSSAGTRGENQAISTQLRELLTLQPIFENTREIFCHWDCFRLARREQDAPDIDHYEVIKVLDFDGNRITLSTHAHGPAGEL